MDKVSEFQKNQIMEIYEALKSFVSEMAIENEDEYYRIRSVIARKKLVLPEPIKTFGNHEVPVKLHKDVTAKLTVKVTEA